MNNYTNKAKKSSSKNKQTTTTNKIKNKLKEKKKTCSGVSDPWGKTIDSIQLYLKVALIVLIAAGRAIVSETNLIFP